MEYHAGTVQITIGGLQEEIDLRCSGFVKANAVAAKALVPLWAELELAGDIKNCLGKFDPKLLERWALARRKANELIIGKDEEASQVRAVLASKSGFLLSLDPSAQLELSWLRSMLSSSGEKQAQQRILQALPDPLSPELITVQKSMQLLEALAKSPLIKMSSLAVVGKLNAVRETVAAISSNRRPAMATVTDCDLSKQVRARIAYFLKVDAGAGKHLWGLAAAKHTYEQCLRTFDKDPDHLNLTMLQPLVVFGFMLQDDHQAKISAMVTSVVQRLGSCEASSSGSKRAGATTGKSTAKKAKVAQLDKEVSILFE